MLISAVTSSHVLCTPLFSNSLESVQASGCFFLQPRQSLVVLLKPGLGLREQFVEPFLWPDHDAVIISDDQVAVSDDRASDRDGATYERRSILPGCGQGRTSAPDRKA